MFSIIFKQIPQIEEFVFYNIIEISRSGLIPHPSQIFKFQQTTLNIKHYVINSCYTNIKIYNIRNSTQKLGLKYSNVSAILPVQDYIRKRLRQRQN